MRSLLRQISFAVLTLALTQAAPLTRAYADYPVEPGTSGMDELFSIYQASLKEGPDDADDRGQERPNDYPNEGDPRDVRGGEYH